MSNPIGFVHKEKKAFTIEHDGTSQLLTFFYRISDMLPIACSGLIG
jgi:hypothetical protein